MDIGVLISYKKQAGITSQILSQKSGVPLGTINKILRGETKNPQIDTVAALCRVLECPLSKVTGVSIPDREKISCFNDFPLDTLSNKPLFNKDDFDSNTYIRPKKLPFLKTNKLSDKDENISVLVNNPHPQADFAIKICDDSMAPKFKNGDIIFAKRTNLIFPDDIGVFKINGEIYVRKFQNNSLLALNSAYPSFLLENTELESVEGVVIL